MSSCVGPVTPLPDCACVLAAGSDLKQTFAHLRADVMQLESDYRAFNKEFGDILNLKLAKKIRDALTLYATSHAGPGRAAIQMDHHPTASTGSIVPYTGPGEVEQYKRRCQEMRDLKAVPALRTPPCKMCAYLKNVLSNSRLMVMAGGLRVYDEKMDPDYSETRTGYPSELAGAPCRKRPRTASVSCETDFQPSTLPPITIDPRIAPTQPFGPCSANSDASAHSGSTSSCSPAYPFPSPGGAENRPPSHGSADLTFLRVENDRLKQELADSKATVKRHSTLTQVNEDKYRMFIRQHRQVEKELQESRSETARLTEDHEKLKKKYDGRMTELDRFDEVNRKQKVYIERLQGEKRARRASTPCAPEEKELARLRCQLQVETDSPAQTMQQAAELRKKAGLCEETSFLLKERTDELTALQCTLAALQSQLEECQNDKAASDSKLSVVERAFRSKEQALLCQRQINERSEQKLSEGAKRIKELVLDSQRAAREDASAVRELSAEIARLTESLGAEQALHQTANSEIDNLRSELTGAKSDIANKENSIVSLKTEKTEIEDAKRRIEDNIASEKKYSRQASTKLDVLKAQLQSQQQRADAEEKRLSLLVETLELGYARILRTAAEKENSHKAEVSSKDAVIARLQHQKEALIAKQTKDNERILHAAAEKEQSHKADISSKDAAVERLQKEQDALIAMQAKDNERIVHTAAEKEQSYKAEVSTKDAVIERLQHEKDALVSKQTEAARATARERTALKDEIDSLKTHVKNAQGIAEGEKETLMEVRRRKNVEIDELQGGISKMRRNFDEDVENGGSERANLCKGNSRRIQDLRSEGRDARTLQAHGVNNQGLLGAPLMIQPTQAEQGRQATSTIARGFKSTVLNGKQAAGRPPIATQCFMLSNLFDPASETAPNWEKEVRDDLMEECSKHGGVLHMFVDKTSPQGNVYFKCPSVASAVAAVSSLHGRWFAGKVINANYIPVKNYHELFPDLR